MPTPNISGDFAEGLPDTLVIHFTGGSSAKSSASYLCRPDVKASAHLVIGRDGSLFQLAPFNQVTWHAGKSRWQGRSGLNKYAIGIELDNAGELKDNGNLRYLSWFNKAYSPDEVFFGTHRNRAVPSYWHTYSEEQIALAFDICRLLCEHYDIKTIVGHEEIAPGRKSDPGPAFPLDRLREKLLTEDRKSEQSDEDADEQPAYSVVTASKLNIRSGPGTQYEPAGEPLLKDVMVKPLRSEGNWTEVEYTLKGWVSSQYIKPAG